MEKVFGMNNSCVMMGLLVLVFVGCACAEPGGNDIKTLVTGEQWNLGGGYALEAKQIDLEGNKVWLCLYKDGGEIDSEVVDTGSPNLQNRVYAYTEGEVLIFSCYVSAVFRGTCSNMVQINDVFLIGGLFSGDYGFALDDYRIGSVWDLSEGYSIAANDVAYLGNKARITLLKDGVVVDERMLTEKFMAPIDSDCRYSYSVDETEIITATLKAAFHGCESDAIQLAEVYQRSEIGGSILIDNESHLFRSADPTGIPWDLTDGYVLTSKDIGFNDGEVWLELSKNGMIMKEMILNEDFVSTFTCTSGTGRINGVVDHVFHGSGANVVKLMNVSQYSDVNGTALLVDETHFYKTSDPDGAPWRLSDDYVLTVKHLDIYGDKVWLELSKDGDMVKEGILESGDLFEYRNGLESVDCTVEAVFKGTLTDVVKLRNVNQYSSTGTRLIDDGSKTYASADPTGEVWERWEGYSLDPKDIDLEGNKVWLSLSKNGAVVKDAIVDSGESDADRWFKYYNATGALVFSTYVDAVFRGTDSNLIQLKYTTQYSEIDGRVFIEPSTESWQLQEGYYLTAQEMYWNDSVWLQLSKNDKLVDEGLFYGSFDLQNDTAGHTMVFGTISSYNPWQDYVQLTSVTQYQESTGAVLATGQSATLYASWSLKTDKKTLCTGVTIIEHRGDPDRDGEITPTDAMIALQIVAGGGCNADADVSGDGNVTSLDALMILQAAAGAIEL
ncbi:MAG: S-layer protein domain-containing protein [Euryarchaeota archaeon]|nr:S-layer protein domain-containing protein [Euryarchaeota archaeon]